MAEKKKDTMKTPEAKALLDAGYKDFGAMDVRRFAQYLTQTGNNTQAALAMFKIYMDTKPTEPAEKPDPVAEKLSEMLNKAFPKGEGISLGRYGYTVILKKGRGVEPGIAVYKNDKPE